MPANLTIENVPDHVVDRLRQLGLSPEQIAEIERCMSDDEPFAFGGRGARGVRALDEVKLLFKRRALRSRFGENFFHVIGLGSAVRFPISPMPDCKFSLQSLIALRFLGMDSGIVSERQA
jgi:hypothetical protein